MSSSNSDDEKATIPSPSEDEFLVKWDDNDHLNPQNLPVVRKWLITVAVCVGALAVTCGSSIYSAIYDQIIAEFHSSQEVVTLGLSLFVIGLAGGPMFVSPLSEFYGRRFIYIISMILYFIWNIPCATAQNMQTLLIGRFFDGLCGSAFMSVAAGTVTDLFAPQDIQAPMILFTITPFLGPVLGPLLGGFINSYVSWRWTFYVMLIWTGILSGVLIFVPETYAPVLLSQKAAAMRKSTGNESYYSASEKTRASRPLSVALKESLYRPFQLLFLEPMCTLLCIYSALLLGILYLFFGAFPLVFTTNHGFNLWQNGLTFLGLVVGQFLAAALNPFFRKNYLRLVAEQRAKEKEGEQQRPAPEFRLPPAIVGGILVPLSLFWFGWTTYSSVHWIVPIIGSVFFGTGMFLAFQGIWTFLVDAYPSYAASALAANVCARCVCAAAFPLFGDQMYTNLGYQWASSLLAFLALAMMPFPYLFYRYGKAIRARSKFAFSS
ncbi:MFS general substrate transporter [Mollisia scopiformis]|uniref:MFS general substrate transporter n=1 Tax=Mollisia scopiformis TaxID=149040 RepID=A0A194XG49_MOLSC|nr:MFS general substrate transporter [Mollisia scopiformis]KUJ19116.1 MFS general substrate transporter [Mollisia scopiformis]